MPSNRTGVDAPGRRGRCPDWPASAQASDSAPAARQPASAAPQWPAATRSTQATPPVDAERVAVIRKAVESGTYPLVPARIADAMIAAGLLLRSSRDMSAGDLRDTPAADACRARSANGRRLPGSTSTRSSAPAVDKQRAVRRAGPVGRGARSTTNAAACSTPRARLNEVNRQVRNLIAANVGARLEALTGAPRLYRGRGARATPTPASSPR